MMMMMMMLDMDERPQPENMSAFFRGEVGHARPPGPYGQMSGFNRSGTRAETKTILHLLNGDSHEMNDWNSELP